MMAESIPVVINMNNNHNHGAVDNSRNKRLFVGSLDRDKTRHDVQNALSDLVSGIVQVIMYSSQQNRSQNRGYAFVEFENHEDAVAARTKLMANPPRLWGATQIKVDWAEPEHEVDENTMKTVSENKE